jgi:hypothetical protein
MIAVCTDVEWQEEHRYDLDLLQCRIPDHNKEEKRKTEACACDSLFSKQKGQLLQTYLVERRRMNKWCMKLFRRLLTTTFLTSSVIYKRDMEQSVD